MKEKREVLLRLFAVYGLMPLLSLLMGVLVVVFQFVNSRVVYPDEGLPFYRSLATINRAFQLKTQETEEAVEEIHLLSQTDVPTEALSALPRVPQGVFPIVRTTIAYGNGLINATDYSADTSVMASVTLAASPESGPTVLVYHTHATESFYEPKNAPVTQIVAGQPASVRGYYEKGSAPRSTSAEENVVAVGRAFCERLEELGVSAVHCTALHDIDYSKAYGNSLASVQQYLQEYPSIRYLVDVHRDSLVREDGTKLAPSVQVNGETVAQVMLVVGTGSEEVSQPNWRENLAVASRYQSYLLQTGEGFCRPVYLRYGRFNQHLSANSLLLEVGSCGNTLEEALLAAEYSASALARMILDAT